MCDVCALCVCDAWVCGACGVSVVVVVGGGVVVVAVKELYLQLDVSVSEKICLPP